MDDIAGRIDGRTLRHQHRRPELLDAAVEYVLGHGVAELSLRPMAEELGVTHATLLRHFGSKEALVNEVIIRIRSDLFQERTQPAGVVDVPLAQALRTVWKRLCQPSDRRQFALLFEVVALESRQPGRFGSLATTLVSDFLEPLEDGLRAGGVPRRDARPIATAFLALVRGLQLDLAVTGDRRRVNAAIEHYIDSVTHDGQLAP